MRRIFMLTLTLVALSAAPVLAMDLISAKTDGLVGEQTDGLIGIVTPPGTPDLQNLVKTTNAGRLDIYRDNAKNQAIPLNQVQAIAGQKLQTGTPAGLFIRTPDGRWIQK